jgi:glycosyltransferase involved in cell wall biosynthesis
MNIYGWVRSTGGVSHYRIREPFRGLALLGHTVTHGVELDLTTINHYDVIVTSVFGEEEASEGWELLARMPNRPKMVYDIDDNVWNFRPGMHQSEYWNDEELLRNVQSCIACADVVTTPSENLAEYLTPLNPNVHVLPNYVPEWLTQVQPTFPPRFTVGYQGGDTHRYDIGSIAPQILRFLGDHPKTNLSVWGAGAYDSILFKHRINVVPWNRNIRDYYMSLAMTIGLAPLEAVPFNNYKSAIKVVEYAALGIPSIATASPTYTNTVIDGTTGILVPPFRNQNRLWHDALELYYADPLSRMKMGNDARRIAKEQWTTERNAHRWEKVYASG